VTLMTTDDLEALLRSWGQAYGTAPVPAHLRADRRSDDGNHPIAIAMGSASGKAATIKQRTTMDRGGQARRRCMAKASGVKGMRIVAAHFVDPVPCRETRYARGAAAEQPVPPELQRVERAALELMRIDPLRGLCLRFNYCTLGPHEEKAIAVAEVVKQPVKLKRFRDELDRARIWMHGRLAA
jgi:hypothetical protein